MKARVRSFRGCAAAVDGRLKFGHPLPGENCERRTSPLFLATCAHTARRDTAPHPRNQPRAVIGNARHCLPFPRFPGFLPAFSQPSVLTHSLIPQARCRERPSPCQPLSRWKCHSSSEHTSTQKRRPDERSRFTAAPNVVLLPTTSSSFMATWRRTSLNRDLTALYASAHGKDIRLPWCT